MGVEWAGLLFPRGKNGPAHSFTGKETDWGEFRPVTAVPWSLSTTDRISTKTEKFKLRHGMQSHIEPTLNWRCSAEHSFDGNAILQSITAFPVTFKDLMEPVFDQAPNAGHVSLFLIHKSIYNV